MVRGRLPRESNPVPGQSQPGFVPAFDETGNEDYVRVSNQKPYPVANYTQDASGVWLPTSQNNPMPTQLTGSNVVKEEILYPREVRNVSTNIRNFTVPEGAKGAIISMRAYGVTGTFGDNDGWCINVLGRANFSAYSDFVTNSNRYSVHTVSSVVIYPGVAESHHFNTILANRIGVQISITGTFDDGEGIDCEVRCTWLR